MQTAQAAAESAAAELRRAADAAQEQQEAAAVVEDVVQQLEAGAAAQQGATAPQPTDAEVATAAAAAVLTEAAIPAASDRVTASPTADTHSQAHAPLPTPFHLKVRLMLLFKCWPRTQVAMAAPVACCNRILQSLMEGVMLQEARAMCPEGISLSSTYCQPSASSSRPSGAPRDCTLPNVGNATSAVLQTVHVHLSRSYQVVVSVIILLQAARTLSRQPSRWSHTRTAPHTSCWMVPLQRAASPPSVPGALAQTLRCAPFLPTRTSTNTPCWSCKDTVGLQMAGWLVGSRFTK
jgi:hypothetical protein